MSEQSFTKQNIPHRPIRSFVKREGKMTKGQLNAIEQLWPTVGVDLSSKQLDLDSLFGRCAFTVLEIGFGNGLSLAEMAELQPEVNFFGIEVHQPGVGSLLVQVKKRDLKNIRVSYNDAVDVIAQQIPDHSLNRIQIFFPDPWHKKRHHKRRLIQADFVAMLVAKLKPLGVLHVATDWQDYAEHILEVLSANKQLSNFAAQSSSNHGYSLKPDYRPSTKYEERGKRLGHSVSDIVFTKSR